MVKETTLLDEIQRNNIREQEVQKESEKEEGQAWEDSRLVYMEERIYILKNQKYESKSYRKTMN